MKVFIQAFGAVVLFIMIVGVLVVQCDKRKKGSYRIELLNCDNQITNIYHSGEQPRVYDNHTAVVVNGKRIVLTGPLRIIEE